MSNLQPYQYEPTYTDEQVLANEKKKQEQVSVFSGRAGNTTWCNCLACEAKPTDFESYCCHESTKIEAVREEADCVTFHAQFDSVVLNKHVLNVVRHQQIIQAKKHNLEHHNFENPDNRLWRHLAYRQFVSWINSWTSIGKNRRLVIPSCVIGAIRNEYPESDGNYVGFKAANDFYCAEYPI